MIAQILETEKVEFRGSVREYDVWSSNLGGAPRYFISSNNGGLFISAEVPQKFRRPRVLHELFEFEVSKPANSHSPCPDELEFELLQVSAEEIEEYAKFRLEVLEESVRFQINHDNTKLVIEIAKNRDYIKNLLE